MVPVGQGFASLTAPSRELEKLVIGRQLRHGGNPVLRWCASNVAVETDAAGNIKPSKKRSTEKIDGIVALIMALSRMIVQPEVPESVYMHRGIDFIGAPEPSARQFAAPEPESPEEAAQQQKLAEFRTRLALRRRYGGGI
jgi:phage terminase large subunit-like protein